MRRALLAVVAVGLLALPGTAWGAFVSVEPSGPSFTAPPGEVNQVTASRSNANFDTFTDLGAPLTAGPGCTSIDAHTARCANPAGRRIRMWLGDGADFAAISGAKSIVSGAEGDDRLRGGAQHDELFGGGGNDRLIGGKGPDRLDGGTGFDVADYSNAGYGVTVTIDDVADDGGAPDGPPAERDNVRSSVEAVDGSAMGDQITGSASANSLRGGGGDDVLTGMGGDDVLDGMAGDDTLNGGAGDDQLTGGVGGDDLSGGADTDVARYADHPAGVTVTLDGLRNDGNATDGPSMDLVRNDVEMLGGTPGADTLVGNAGPNSLMGYAGADVLRGGGGDDLLTGGDGPDDMLGEAGADTAPYDQRSKAVTVTLDGVANDGGAPDASTDNVRPDVETVIGGSAADQLDASAVATRRTLRGGHGNDTIRGSSAGDVLDGGDGHDTIADGLGTDQDFGGAGNDSMTSEGGDDVINGDEGNDSMFITSGGSKNVATLNGGPGDDHLSGGSGKDVLNGGADDDQLAGGSRDDVLNGDDGNDRLNGQLGNDELRGGVGDDDLTGEHDADFQDGGPGFDTVRYDDYHDGFPVGVIVTIGAGTELDGNDSDCVFGLFGDCHGVGFDDRADRVDDAQRLIASAQDDDLTGDDGPNVILARGGADHVDSRGGDDAIDLVDGVQDTATCGAGADTVTADAIDVVDPSCDTVNVP